MKALMDVPSAGQWKSGGPRNMMWPPPTGGWNSTPDSELSCAGEDSIRSLAASGSSTTFFKITHSSDLASGPPMIISSAMSAQIVTRSMACARSVSYGTAP